MSTVSHLAVGELLRSGQDVPATSNGNRKSWSAALHAFGLKVIIPPYTRARITIPTARTYPAIEAFIASQVPA